MIMAALCPTAMLFIRCRDGVSHNPAEHVEPPMRRPRWR
jgi:allantoate deiminase